MNGMKSIRFPPPVADEMIRAILEGRRTVTRRVVMLEYSNTHLEMFTNKYGTRLIEKQNFEPGVTIIKHPDGSETRKLLAYIEKTPPYRPGDILYVREKWCSACDGEKYFYFADKCTPKEECKMLDYDNVCWRPSIHMPRKAARLFLRVTDVRVEQLQEICGGDLLKEGIDLYQSNFVRVAFKEFEDLWDSTIKSADRALYGWAANPWVWVIEFERCDKPEGNDNGVD